MNGIAVAGIYKMGLTHMTGLTTNAARVLINPNATALAVYWFYVYIFAFCFGALIAGFVIGPARLTWGRLQGICMIIEGLSAFSGWYLAPEPVGGLFLSLSMGVQNGITSNFSALTVRTSHVSGTVLDIGLTLGQMLRDRNLDNFWKLKVHFPSYISFWSGSIVGTIAWNVQGKDALWPCGIFPIVVGVITLIYRTYLLHYPPPASTETLTPSPTPPAPEEEQAKKAEEEAEKIKLNESLSSRLYAPATPDFLEQAARKNSPLAKEST